MIARIKFNMNAQPRYYELVNSQLRLLHFYLFDWLKNSDYEPIVGVLRHMENSASSLKIFRTKFSTSALYNGRNKISAAKPGLRIY